MVVIIGYGFLGKALYKELKSKSDIAVISRSIDEFNNRDFIIGNLYDIPEILSGLGKIYNYSLSSY